MAMQDIRRIQIILQQQKKQRYLDMRACSNSLCSSTNFIQNQQNELICLECSYVQENNNLVSDVHFENNILTGKVIKHNKNLPSFMTISEQTQQKAQKLLYQNMNIPVFDADPALQAYMYAQHRNFIKGRHSAHVAAACLYIVSRERNKPHLLIDFADALHINLYTLGACFLKLVRFLHKDLPLIDPSVFIRRFCSGLEFGEKQLEVEITANRLLKRMRVDWLEQGRRPSSLCGAAILISARYHGFKRTTQQMVQVVNVCDETLRKRIEEFKQTSVAKLTREEFARLDQGIVLEEELYPPSFKKAIKNKSILHITDFEDKLNYKADEIEQQLKDFELTSEVSSRKSSFYVPEQTALQEYDPAKIEYPSLPDDQEESLSEMEEEEKDRYILSQEESQIKTQIWSKMHKEWIDEQVHRTFPVKKSSYCKKRAQRNNEMINAPDAVSALIKESKISNRLNTEMVRHLFDPEETPLVKKIQLDAL